MEVQAVNKRIKKMMDMDENANIMAPTIQKKKKSTAYNYDLLVNAFGQTAMNDSTIKYNQITRRAVEMGEYTFQYLKSNFRLLCNKQQPLSCFPTCNGSLAMFSFAHCDVEILNNLLQFLIAKLNVDTKTNTILPIEYMDATHFARIDRLTTFWDTNGKRIYQLP